MKRKLNSVLRSRSGASITFALLLFLVCAVVGSLVLTAGSAAAGHISEMADMDQRYYSVSSAANLLAQELSGKTVTVVRTKTTTTVTSKGYLVDFGAGQLVQPDPAHPATVSESASYLTEVNDTISLEGDSKEFGSGMSFLTARAVELLFGQDGGTPVCNTEEAMNATMKNGCAHNGSFELTHTSADVDASVLTVLCKYSVAEDGTIYLTLTNKKNTKDSDKGHYCICVTLSPDIKETSSETTDDSSKRTNYEGGYLETVTTTTKLVKTSEISWTVSGVEKQSYDSEAWGGG